MQVQKQFERQLFAIWTIAKYNESIAQSGMGMAHWLVKISVMEVVCVAMSTGLC